MNRALLVAIVALAGAACSTAAPITATQASAAALKEVLLQVSIQAQVELSFEGMTDSSVHISAINGVSTCLKSSEAQVVALQKRFIETPGVHETYSLWLLSVKKADGTKLAPSPTRLAELGIFSRCIGLFVSVHG